MSCRKHPLATGDGLCPVCLLEEALASPLLPPDEWAWPGEDVHQGLIRRLTVELPLGATTAGSVFLVRQEAPDGGLLRLKTWHRAAPDEFLDRFAALQQALAAAGESSIVPPLAACVDGGGRPSVLSDFRQGVPIVDAVGSGALAPRAAVELIGALDDVVRRMHRRGLAHGSLGPGNVMVAPGMDAAFLLDFGLSALVGTPAPLADTVAGDCTHLRLLSEALVAFPARRSQPPV